jgi:hypothetical protein
MRPSRAHSVRRSASPPSQAPLPSSEIGRPQPPTRCICPLRTAQPTVPVPAMMTPPSLSPCAPMQAACASVVMMALRNGCFCCCAAASSVGSLAPAKARQATIRARLPRDRPARSRHCAATSKTVEKLCPSPRRRFAGPNTASPRIPPENAHRRARQRVPPPSTPRSSMFGCTGGTLFDTGIASPAYKNEVAAKWFGLRTHIRLLRRF